MVVKNYSMIIRGGRGGAMMTGRFQKVWCILAF